MINQSVIRTLECENNYRKPSFHTIAPYIGKLRPELVRVLINKYSSNSHIIYDPFCGSGTVLLEAWIMGRETVGVDLNYYAVILSKAKLFPHPSLDIATKHLEECATLVDSLKKSYFHIDNIPEWVSKFFHRETLKEISIWMDVLKNKEEFFLMACLLGILHHQRPGFLSFPSSNGAPYLRNEKYPISEYPAMYEYRNVYERLSKKVIRSYRELPRLDFSIKRDVHYMNTLEFRTKPRKDFTIITSPPYMKSLTYARDNRLRLWFLGVSDWMGLDKSISVNKKDFFILIKNCFMKWSNMQNSGNHCILVLGDIVFDKNRKQSLPDLICAQAEESNYTLVDIFDDPIDRARKVVKTDAKIKAEKICIFQRR